MNEINQADWTTVCPPGWVTENTEDSVLFYQAEEGIGTLEISCFCRDDEPVTMAELDELAADAQAADATRINIQIGNMNGLMLSYEEENLAWKEWYLMTAHCLFFITYHCPEDMAGIEDEELAVILDNLQTNPAN